MSVEGAEYNFEGLVCATSAIIVRPNFVCSETELATRFQLGRRAFDLKEGCDPGLVSHAGCSNVEEEQEWSTVSSKEDGNQSNPYLSSWKPFLFTDSSPQHNKCV